MPLPFDPVHSAILDRLCLLEEALDHEVHGPMEALHLRLSALEEAVLAHERASAITTVQPHEGRQP